jgi:hypothetical protein
LRPFTTLGLAPPQIVAQRLDKALVPGALVAGYRVHIVSAQTLVDSGERGREQGKVGKYPDLFQPRRLGEELGGCASQARKNSVDLKFCFCKGQR